MDDKKQIAALIRRINDLEKTVKTLSTRLNTIDRGIDSKLKKQQRRQLQLNR